MNLDKNCLEYIAQWMKCLDCDVRNLVPIYHLAIPGVFMSVSYEETETSRVPILENMCTYFPNSSETGSSEIYDVTDLLKKGIRYISFRVLHPNKFTTACKCQEKPNCPDLTYPCLEETLVKIETFLRHYPDEFVIIDFQLFTNMMYSDHLCLQKLLVETFGKRTFTRWDGKLGDLTLARASQMEKQIIIIYRLPVVDQYFWTGRCWPIHSPKTSTRYADIESFLKLGVFCRDQSLGQVLKYTVLPEKKNCLLEFWRKFIGTFSNIGTRVENWMVSHRLHLANAKHYSKINIVVLDHIVLETSCLPVTIISINWKLDPTYEEPKPSKSSRSKRSWKRSGSSRSKKSSKSAKSSKSTKSTKSTKSKKSIKSTKSTKSVKSTKSAKSTKSEKPPDPVEKPKLEI